MSLSDSDLHDIEEEEEEIKVVNHQSLMIKFLSFKTLQMMIRSIIRMNYYRKI